MPWHPSFARTTLKKSSQEGSEAPIGASNHVRATHPDVAARMCAGAAAAHADKCAQSASLICFGTARLSALRRGTRQAGRNQHWLRSRTGFPATSQGRCFARQGHLPRFNTLRVDRSYCRSTGDPEPPGSGLCESARGHRTRPTFRIASGMCPSMSEIRGFCSLFGDESQGPSQHLRQPCSRIVRPD